MRNRVVLREEGLSAGRAGDNFEILPGPVSETAGASVFHRSGPGETHRACSCCSRGVGKVEGARPVLDFVPEGRDDGGLRYAMR